MRSLLVYPLFIVLTILFSLIAILVALVDSSGIAPTRRLPSGPPAFFLRGPGPGNLSKPLTPGAAYILAANHQSAYDILAFFPN